MYHLNKNLTQDYYKLSTSKSYKVASLDESLILNLDFRRTNLFWYTPSRQNIFL